MNITNRRKCCDVFLFLGASALFAHKATGDSAHEWLGIVVLALLFWHLILNWNWLVSCVRKFFGRLPGIVRFNFILDFLLYFLFVGATATGILISRTFLKTFDILIQNDPLASYLHRQFIAWLIVALGIHLGVHYRWIFNAFRRSDAPNEPENSTKNDPKTTAAQAISTVEQKGARQ